jgi:hypothetical protein
MVFLEMIVDLGVNNMWLNPSKLILVRWLVGKIWGIGFEDVFLLLI